MKRLPYIICCLLMWSLGIDAQVTVESSIDNLVMLIGEQRELTVEVTSDASQRVIMPDYRPLQEIAPGVEIVEPLGFDTMMLNNDKRKMLTGRWSITAFDSMLVRIPPIEVLVDDSTYYSKALALKVLMMDVDTTQLDVMAPPKDVQDEPMNFNEDFRESTLYTYILLLLFAALLFSVLRYSLHKPLIRMVRRIIRRPAHQVAMEEIARIKAEKRWAEEDSKEYYTELTDTLRTYIKERYGFNATEMTSTEIIDHLIQTQDETGLQELRHLFETADLVKFAKWTTLINENDMNLVNAIDFINQTKTDDVPKPEPVAEEVLVQQRLHSRQKAIMLTIIAVLSISVVALWILVLWMYYNLVL